MFYKSLYLNILTFQCKTSYNFRCSKPPAESDIDSWQQKQLGKSQHCRELKIIKKKRNWREVKINVVNYFTMLINWSFEHPVWSYLCFLLELCYVYTYYGSVWFYVPYVCVPDLKLRGGNPNKSLDLLNVGSNSASTSLSLVLVVSLIFTVWHNTRTMLQINQSKIRTCS